MFEEARFRNERIIQSLCNISTLKTTNEKKIGNKTANCIFTKLILLEGKRKKVSKKIRIFRRVIISEKTLKTLLIVIMLRLASLCFKTYINPYQFSENNYIHSTYINSQKKSRKLNLREKRICSSM